MFNLGSLAFLIFVPLTALFACTTLLLSLFDSTGNGYLWLARRWGNAGLWLTGIRLHITGGEHVNPSTPCIIVCNHASLIDIPAVLAGLETNFRLVVKRELSRVPLMGWTLRRGDFILVSRDRVLDGARSLEEAEAKLAAGKSVFFFADGTRSQNGELKPFKRGAFVLAARSGYPLLPVALLGTHLLIPNRTFKIFRGTATLAISPLISAAGKTAEALRDEAFAAVSRSFEKFSEPSSPVTEPALIQQSPM
ncbi:MAG: 1-acyl-sn-glycerol-3-phosphate acyltransferase [Rhizobacter sp.]|nr:1-acyl-sn-glycerol-3-phosphate acyltransferase [Chlorobiales bacterium]